MGALGYRNYVIDAVNADIPYDRFLVEQLAGDLLEAGNPAEARRLQVATGLLAIGQKSSRAATSRWTSSTTSWM
ncbi:MAG: hypothetical protein CM1200mP2_35840 [Planctomycetaceae bacterium]|nr:MAG: hypothetical protein CM1200mP2_35840 [Planctomycetaceae bacterium]